MVQGLLGLTTTVMELVVSDLHNEGILQAMVGDNFLVIDRILGVGICGSVILKQDQIWSQNVKFVQKWVILLQIAGKCLQMQAQVVL